MGFYHLASDEEIDVLRYFTLLRDQLALALNRSSHDFKEYSTSMKLVEEARRQANKILDRLPDGEQYSWAQSISRETLLAFITSLPGLSVLNSVLSDDDLGQKFRGFVDAGLNMGVAQIKEQLERARDFVYAKLDRKLGTYLEPLGPLSQALGHDLVTLARKRPLLLFFDTYEEIDEGDPLLRYVMAAAGAHVGWVFSGRDNLWAGLSQRYRHAVADYGYRDLVPPDRRFEVNFSADGVGDFALSDIQEYFAQVTRLCEKARRRPSLPAISEKDAAHLLEVTQGVPLAVKIAATLYLEIPDIQRITSGGEEKHEMVDRMVQRYLLHTRTNPEDKARLYGLALLRRREERRNGTASLPGAKRQKEVEEPRAIAAALDLSPSASYRSELIRLHRRYGFVFSQRGEPALHQEVRHFLRLWLLEHRMDPEIMTVNQRLKEAHLTAFQELETYRQYPNLRARFKDEQWVKIYLDLTEQCFWLDPAQGVQSILPFMLAAGVYYREANRDAVTIGNFFKPVLVEPYRSHWQWAADSLWHTDSRNPLDDELRGLEALIKLMRQSPFTFPALPLDFHKELEAALWWRFGDAYQGRDEVKAREWWRKAHHRLPQETELRRVLATERESNDKPEPTMEERAIDDFTRAIEADPTNVALYAHRGEAYFNKNEYQRTIADLERALELGATKFSIYFHLGKAYLHLNENGQALSYFNHALEQDATAAACYAERGIAYKNLGEYQHAIADLEHALQLDSSQASTYYNVGKVHMELSEYRKAITYFTHALERDTKSAQLYTDRGIAYKNLGEYEQALLDFDVALHLDLKSPQVLKYRGEVYLHLSKHHSSGEDRNSSLAPTSSPSSSHSSQPPHAHLSPSSNVIGEHRLSRRTIIAGAAALGLVTIGGGLTWRRFFPLGLSMFPRRPSNLLYVYHGHSDNVTSVTWLPDGRRIASGSGDQTVQVWDAASGGHVYIYRGHTKRVTCLARSPNGTRIASGSDDQTVQVWDAASGGHVYIYHGHTNGVQYVAWSPDGTRIASGAGGTVQVWNAQDGKRILIHPGVINCVAWSPDGTRIAWGSYDQTVQVWDAQSGNHLLTYALHRGGISSLDWSPDGMRIASGSHDYTVQVWNAQNGRHLLTYNGHLSEVWTTAWSPDGTRIASGSEDATVQVWDAQNGELLLSYGGNSGDVHAVAWSPDGTRIVSGGYDTTVQVWRPA